MATTEAPRLEDHAAVERRPWHVLDGLDVAQALGVDPTQGLSSAEAATRLEQYGPNKFAEAKTEPRWHAFIRQYVLALVVIVAAEGRKWWLRRREASEGVPEPTS